MSDITDKSDVSDVNDVSDTENTESSNTKDTTKDTTKETATEDSNTDSSTEDDDTTKDIAEEDKDSTTGDSDEDDTTTSVIDNYDGINNDIVDYFDKLRLFREYSYYYTDKDLATIFKYNNIDDILKNYTYDEIKAKLVNTKINTEEKDIDIGDIVIVKKPYLRNDEYVYLKGLVIGIHKEYRDINHLEYYNVYDILKLTRRYTDGYGYEVSQESVDNLYLTDKSIENAYEIINKLNIESIDKMSI